MDYGKLRSNLLISPLAAALDRHLRLGSAVYRVELPPGKDPAFPKSLYFLRYLSLVSISHIVGRVYPHLTESKGIRYAQAPGAHSICERQSSVLIQTEPSNDDLSRRFLKMLLDLAPRCSQDDGILLMPSTASQARKTLRLIMLSRHEAEVPNTSGPFVPYCLCHLPLLTMLHVSPGQSQLSQLHKLDPRRTFVFCLGMRVTAVLASASS